MAQEQSRTAGRAVMAAAVALFVIGVGAALGMGGSGGSTKAEVGAGEHLATGARPGPTVAPSPVATAPPSTTKITASTAAPAPSSASPASQPGGVTLGAGSSSAPAAGPGSTAGAAPDGSASAAGGTAPTTADTAAPAGSEARLPPSGTYDYATSGNQDVSMLGSSNYPAQTPIVVASNGCGVSETWKSSPGNSQTVVECPVAGGVHVVSESTTVQSGGYSMTQTFTCGADAFVPVTSGKPGQTWSWECTSPNGEKADQVVKLIGPQTAVVDGVPVSAVEVSVASTLSGPEQGTVNSDYWLTSSALPVKETGDTNASMGVITFRSHYSLQLDSLTPTS